MQFSFDRDDLIPLIREVVAKTIAEVDTGRVAYTEEEAAKMLGLQRHQLRDRRLEGEIIAAKVGNRWLYTRRDLEEFLERKRG